MPMHLTINHIHDFSFSLIPSQTQIIHNIQTIFINPPKYTKHVKHVNTYDITTTTAVSRDNALTYMPT